MAMTEYAKGPTWFFVGGNIDQGLFWYVLYVKLGVGTWASEAGRSAKAARAPG